MQHIGVLGCGQLARMFALEGARMGLRFSFVAIGDEDVAPIQSLAHSPVPRWHGGNDDNIFHLLRACDVTTCEREDIPAALLDLAERASTLYPSRECLQAVAHRDNERDTVTGLGLPVSPFAIAREPRCLQACANELGFPVVIKTVRGGYDGRGQWRARDAAQLQTLEITAAAYPVLIERQVAFHRELSITAVRSVTGDIRFYALAENRHANGVLISAQAPADCKPGVEQAAKTWIARLMQNLDYVGVLTIELFETSEGLLVNEVAPRVHNTAHWTLGGAMTSQFENHLRAITGAPLGNTSALGHCAIVNVLGKHPPPHEEWLCDNMHWHDYTKTARAGRKLGHVLVRDAHRESIVRQIRELENLLALAPRTH